MTLLVKFCRWQQSLYGSKTKDSNLFPRTKSNNNDNKTTKPFWFWKIRSNQVTLSKQDNFRHAVEKEIRQVFSNKPQLTYSSCKLLTSNYTLGILWRFFRQDPDIKRLPDKKHKYYPVGIAAPGSERKTIHLVRSHNSLLYFLIQLDETRQCC